MAKIQRKARLSNSSTGSTTGSNPGALSDVGLENIAVGKDAVGLNSVDLFPVVRDTRDWAVIMEDDVELVFDVDFDAIVATGDYCD